MKRNLIPVYVAVFLIGATALWYFGHHRPAQKILEAEPKRVYKSTPLQPEGLSVTSNPSTNSTQEANEGDTDIEVEGIDTETENMANAATPEKNDNRQELSEDTDSDELNPQEELSVEDAAAAETFEKYFTAESEYQTAQEVAKEALKSGNNERIKAATEALKQARLQRNAALQNLAAYSEDAAEILAQVKETEKRADEVAAAFEDGYDAGMQELLAEFPFLRDMLIERGYLPSE